eukprot:CAMPEP_0169317752 /NCGR_PEP_ID=MMETSP1017-20121227/6888_1 /TAXON_ID=342587 /ORGANISM="Karlodinium micrum, Strain CCMP2283" /LENGTH=471 /DNA_ID=CAMNT_0009411917 /DNA_START=1 /DNA_END=1413 /DNA_ORIENTATION=-
MFGLSEEGKVKNMQKSLHDLLDSNLPADLQRKILTELWGTRLLSLGLFRLVNEWCPRFHELLALECREEVLASSLALFREGEASGAAYFVLKGELVARSWLDCEIPAFRKDEWLGENALINPHFLRGFSAFTTELTSLMVVHAERFHSLIGEYEIEDRFELWIREELWRGLCGRCGELGDHFGDKCPTLFHHARSKEIKWWEDVVNNNRRSMDNMVNTGSESTPARELVEFLRHNKLEQLYQNLNEMEIYSLDDLQNATGEVRCRLMDHFTLTASQMKTLSPKRIKTFRKKLEKEMSKAYASNINDHEEHFIFLSHYKVEAGTEAALMRSELENLMSKDHNHPGNRRFTTPLFLDSEDLSDLEQLKEHVKQSHNIVLLLTREVLLRPWCLVEIVTAVQHRIPVKLVTVQKKGNEFVFPDNDWYKKLLEGKVLTNEATAVLSEAQVALVDIETCIREIFKTIAFPYSPHRPM